MSRMHAEALGPIQRTDEIKSCRKLSMLSTHVEEVPLSLVE